MMFSFDFFKVWPIHAHLFLLLVHLAGSWPVLSHRSSFLMVFDHNIFIIRLRRLLINAWTFFKMVLEILHVSDP